MYRIGEFSKMSKTTVKTLRYYDNIGLLKPEYVDDISGYRFYTTAQLVKLHSIQSLRQIGLSIEEVDLVLKGHNKIELLQKRKTEIENDININKQQLSRIDFILSGKDEENFLQYEAIIKDLPDCIVYYKRMVIPNYNAYFDVIPKLGETMITANPDVKCVVPEYCYIIELDRRYKETNINIEYCEAVDRIGKEVDGIKFKHIKSVKAVTIMHKGPYENLVQAYAYIMRWIEENGYEVADYPRANYIDGIWNKENIDDWLTEIQVPIKKK